MKYDFTSIMDRRGRDALAIDSVGHGHAPGAPREGFDVIPMWIADMNFPTIPTVPAAIIERAKHPVYGYFFPSDAYFNAIFRWQEQRHGVTGLTRENIGYENGVLGGVVSALNVFCSKGGNVLLHSPTYTGFTGALGNNGYNMILSPLVKDENGVWRMDFEDMERRIVENHIHAAVFCSPHNPTGRVWERWEVERFTELCAKHDVFIVSDEIWSDIVRPGVVHTPTQSVSEDAKNRTLALYAPSKTFNLAGLVGSYHIAYSPWIRDRMEKECSLSHYDSMNVLSMHALIAAYSPEGQRVGGRAVRRARGQHRFRLQLYQNALRRRGGHEAGGHIHTLCGLYKMVRSARKDHRRRGKSVLGCRRRGAGRAAVPRSLPHPHESRAAALPRAGGLRPAGQIRFQRITLQTRPTPLGSRLKRLRLAAAHSLCAEGAQLARLRAKKYFCRCACHRQKCFKLPLRLRAQTLRGFFDRKSQWHLPLALSFSK